MYHLPGVQGIGFPSAGWFSPSQYRGVGQTHRGQISLPGLLQCFLCAQNYVAWVGAAEVDLPVWFGMGRLLPSLQGLSSLNPVGFSVLGDEIE